MWEALEYDFMQHALLAIVLGSIACGLLGSIVVVNKMTFLAGGISHFAYGGVGLGVFWLAATSYHLGVYGWRSPHLGEMDSTKQREFRQNSESALGSRDGFWSIND